MREDSLLAVSARFLHFLALFAEENGEIKVCQAGASLPFSEELAKEILLEDEIDVLITLHDGTASATAWGCDLTYDYVKINGDYRT